MRTAHEIRNEVVEPGLVVGKWARYWQKRQNLCLLDKGNTNIANLPRERRHRKSMTHPSVHVQIAPTSVPSTPSWLGEVAVVAHVFSQLGLQKAIEERVRFARARMGDYEVIDFVVMLLGYAVSGERTLQSFYHRLLPKASPFMALFGRANLPHPATLSRDLSALDQAAVEALRTLFQEDLVARAVFASPPGGVWDRLGTHWTVVDVDGTKQAVRQRALPQTADRAFAPSPL
jgi:hypothetical protein